MPSDKEMINNLIDSYTSLQRIKKATYPCVYYLVMR